MSLLPDPLGPNVVVLVSVSFMTEIDMFTSFFASDRTTRYHKHLKKIMILHEKGKYKRIINPGVARGVMVIVVGNGYGDTSSNPGRDWLHFS